MWAAIAHTTGCMYTAVRYSPRPMHSGRDDAALHKAVYLSCLSAGVPTRSKKSAPRGWVLVLIWVADLPGGRTRQNGFLHRHPLHKSPPPRGPATGFAKKTEWSIQGNECPFSHGKRFFRSEKSFRGFSAPGPPGGRRTPLPGRPGFPPFRAPPKKGGREGG